MRKLFTLPVFMLLVGGGVPTALFASPSITETNTSQLNVEVPSSQAANIVFSNVTQSSMKVRWSRGNGDKH